MSTKDIIHTISDQLLEITISKTPIIIGINGIDAVGKTFFTDKLSECLKNKTERQIIQSSIDNFTIYRGIAEGKKPHLEDNADKWYYEQAFPITQLQSNFFDPIINWKIGNTCKLETFKWSTDSMAQGSPLEIQQKAIILFEGVFIFRPELKNNFDVKIFLDGDMNTIMDRGLQRAAKRGQDVEEIRKGFISCYHRAQKRYLSECKPQNISDILIDNTDYQTPLIKRNSLTNTTVLLPSSDLN